MRQTVEARRNYRRPVTIHASGWGWRYSSRNDWAVRELSLDIEPGERVLLLGASGSGKSTVLAGLAGMCDEGGEGETEGTLQVDGRPAGLTRGRSGLLLQDPDAQVILSRVGDDVAFACENLGVPRDEIWKRVPACLREVGLDLPLDYPTRQLSGGQKQRLALAGLLAMEPGLLLLDEPTANLDLEGVGEVAAAVSRVVQERSSTLIVVEHRVDIWRDLVDRVIVLSAQGGILDDGNPSEVLSDRFGVLQRTGVWLSRDHVPAPPRVRHGEPLLTATNLQVGRSTGFRRRRVTGKRTPPGYTLPATITLEIGEGESLALIGRNGSGKSTLALTLGGLVPPRAGSLVAEPILANSAATEPSAWSSRELISRMGCVFQNPEHQFLTSTVQDELALGPRMVGVSSTETDRRVRDLLERLGLDRLARAHPFTLSGGQKRRLSVATALATKPRLLICDEPTFGQDSLTWRALVDLINELRQDGHAIIAATHDIDFVFSIGAKNVTLEREAQVLS